MHLLVLTVLWLALALAIAIRLACAASPKRALRPPETPFAAPGLLSVVVPMRNEARNIEACLEGLLTQRYDAAFLEVIVVDDGSTDGSASIANAVIARLQAQSRARVIAARPLPPGWLGKANACRCGAESARGEWIAFVDADVQCGEALFESAVAHAHGAQTDLLSLVPRQRVETFWERALLLPLFVLFGAALPLSDASNRRTSTTIANGQFLLFRRESYEALGGHRAVRAAMLDDYAFARGIRDAGMRGELRLAMHYFSCRMYVDLAGIWNGMANNMIGFLGGSPARALLWSALYAALGAGSLGLPLLDALSFTRDPGSVLARATVAAACVASMVIAAIALGAVRSMRATWTSALWIPFGMIAQTAVLAASWRRHVRRTFRWRGREIRLDTTASAFSAETTTQLARL